MKEIFTSKKYISGFVIMTISAFLFIFLANMPVYAGDFSAKEAEQKAGTEKENPGIQAILERLDKVQERVGKLEKKVKDQENIIRTQRKAIEAQEKALEKAGEAIPELKKAMAPPERKVFVESFVLSGVNLFNTKDFEPILGRYRDKELGLSDLKKIADEITAFYRSKGYITSLAYAPTQEIDDTSVEFRVIEGRVGNVEVEEGKYYSSETIKRQFFVREGQILDYERLEKSIKRINKQPDRTVRAVLMPGKEPETSDILVKMEEEERPMHIFLDYCNRGTKYTTRSRFGIGFINNNLIGRDDIFSARARIGEKPNVGSASVDYNVPITPYDTRLGLYGAYSHADIGEQFTVLTPEGEAWAGGGYITHPLFDKDFLDPVALNLTSNVIFGFDASNVKNEIMGIKTSHDQLRVFKGGISFDETDSLGRTFQANELRLGVPNFLGSMGKYDVDASRLDAGGQFLIYKGSVDRITRLPFSSMLITTLKMQFTDRPLVVSEQFVLGGATTIRGFPEDDYLADYGLLSNLELRIPAFVIPREIKVPLDKKGTSIMDALQLVAFVDLGKGYLKTPRVGEKKSKTLIGAGVGFRLELYDQLRARVDFGWPVGKEKPIDGSAHQIHVGVQYDLW